MASDPSRGASKANCQLESSKHVSKQRFGTAGTSVTYRRPMGIPADANQYEVLRQDTHCPSTPSCPASDSSQPNVAVKSRSRRAPRKSRKCKTSDSRSTEPVADAAVLVRGHMAQSPYTADGADYYKRCAMHKPEKPSILEELSLVYASVKTSGKKMLSWFLEESS